MSYPLHAIYDLRGRHVGYLDGPFVLDRTRRVLAEVRAGVVVTWDGRVPGTFDHDRFLDSGARVVAVSRRTLPVPRPVLGILREVGVTVPRLRTPLPRHRASRLTWRQYIEFRSVTA